MFRRKSGLIRFPLIGLTAFIAAISLASSLPAFDVRFGPPPGAALSLDKLLAMDEFSNGEIASGKIPGAIVLIQQHGRPVYLKCFGQRDDGKRTPMTAGRFGQMLLNGGTLDGRAQPADAGLRRISDLFGRSLCADAPGIWRQCLA